MLEGNTEPPVYADESTTLFLGDCIEVMRQMPDCSVDAIVTDPPYELGFMGKSWDASGIAFNPEVWREALRVLKPGGHLLAFSGSRTYHRMAVAVEDAGFEIRDQIMWLYVSGFPKSLDVSKAIDKGEGHWRGRAGAVTSYNGAMCSPNYSRTDKGEPVTAAAAAWQGWGTALKPAHEPIVVARKPLVGTVAANVLEYGTGALNIDGTRVGDMGGRWPANVMLDEEAAQLLDEQSGTLAAGNRPKSRNKGFWADKPPQELAGERLEGGGSSRFFYVAKASKRDRNEGLDGFQKRLKPYGNREQHQVPEGGDPEGSVNDKFTIAPAANFHPTVKPTALMRQLVRLVTPPGGTVLDPFTGSGSTGKAAVLEGFQFVGIEQDPDYIEIAWARIQFGREQVQGTLFGSLDSEQSA